MTPARFKLAIAVAMAVGFGYLTFEYVSARMYPAYALSGTVRLEGKPLAKGVVRFISLEPDDMRFFGGYVENGRYEVPREYGLAPARYHVEFSSLDAEDLKRILEARDRDEAFEVEEKVPARFNKLSEVEIDMRSGTVVHADFDLK